jgi:hypothetical protein
VIKRDRLKIMVSFGLKKTDKDHQEAAVESQLVQGRGSRTPLGAQHCSTMWSEQTRTWARFETILQVWTFTFNTLPEALATALDTFRFISENQTMQLEGLHLEHSEPKNPARHDAR